MRFAVVLGALVGCAVLAGPVPARAAMAPIRAMPDIVTAAPFDAVQPVYWSRHRYWIHRGHRYRHRRWVVRHGWRRGYWHYY